MLHVNSLNVENCFGKSKVVGLCSTYPVRFIETRRGNQDNACVVLYNYL